MEVLDPGHVYELDSIDGPLKQVLIFVKREGEGFPGNVGHHEGTTIQEVCRALIKRVLYLDNQVYDPRNRLIATHLRLAIRLLEQRAAERHGRVLTGETISCEGIEDQPKCPVCGHLGHTCTEDKHEHRD